MSFYTSLNGMKNAQTSLGVIAHNISNSETYGFKRSRTEFSEIVAGSALTNPRMIQGIGASFVPITVTVTVAPGTGVPDRPRTVPTTAGPSRSGVTSRPPS